MRSIKHALLVMAAVSAWVASPPAAVAFNGASTQALVVEGIEVDGALFDWPDEIERHPIQEVLSGGMFQPPGSSADFEGSFRVAYSPGQQALFVAAQIRDDSAVMQGAGGLLAWNNVDGLEVYLGDPASVAPRQYSLRGHRRVAWQSGQGGFSRNATGEEMAGTVTLVDGGLQYELRFDLSPFLQDSTPGAPILAFDVAYSDVDADGSYSWISWGAGGGKYAQTQATGLLTLLDIPAIGGPATGTLAAFVRWAEGVPAAFVPLRVKEADADGWATLRVGDSGRLRIALPAGVYLLAAGDEGSGHEAVSVRVDAGSVTETVLPYRGQRVELRHTARSLSGGRRSPNPDPVRVPAGPGRRNGGWHALGLADGLADATVYDFLQEPDGALWFATLGGATRYDHDRDEMATYAAEQGMCGNSVNSMARSRDGALWFACGGWGDNPGLARLAADGLSDLSEDEIVGSAQAVAPAQEGGVWVLAYHDPTKSGFGISTLRICASNDAF